MEPRVTRYIGHYRHRRFSRRRVGASTGVIEEPNAVLVRSRVPRTGAAFGRRAGVPRCARGPTTTAASAAGLGSRGCSPGESGVAQPRRSRRASHEWRHRTGLLWDVQHRSHISIAAALDMSLEQ